MFVLPSLLLCVLLVLLALSQTVAIELQAAAPSFVQYWDCAMGDTTGQYLLVTASYGTNGDYAYWSEDYGATYTQLGSSQNKWVACGMTYDKQTMYIGSSSSSGIFARSLDAGATFTQVGTINYVSGLATNRYTGQYVVVVCWSANKMFYSTDYGATFTQYSPNNRYNAVAASDDGSRFYVALYSGNSNIGAMYSTDHGATWTTSNLAADSWSSISCTSDGSIVAVVAQKSGGKVYLSTDSGVTYSALANSPTGSQMLTVSISSNQNSNGMYTLLTGDTSASHVYYSMDTGATWSTSATSMNPRSSYLNAVGTTAVVGTNNYMYYSNNTGATFCKSSASSTCNQVFGSTGTPAPSASPAPSPSPTYAPSAVPTASPSAVPTAAPTYTTTATPTAVPTASPTTAFPTSVPTSMPTVDTEVISLHNSGYLVGMASKTIFPVITIGPFLVLVIFSLFFCCVLKSPSAAAEYVAPAHLSTLALTTLVFSVVQFSVTLAGYSQLVRPWVGSWWIALFTVCSVVSTWVISSRTMAIVSMLFALVAFMAALICTVGDGLYYSHVLRSLRSCINTSGEIFGSNRAEYVYGVNTCAMKYTGGDLSCTSRHNKNCYYFQGTSDGDFLLHGYTHLMEAGLVFDILLTTSVFFLFLYQVWTLCDQTVQYQRASTAAAGAAAATGDHPSKEEAGAVPVSTEMVTVSNTV